MVTGTTFAQSVLQILLSSMEDPSMAETFAVFLVSTQRVRLQVGQLAALWRCLRARFATTEVLGMSA